MSLSSHDVALAEKGLQELELLLSLPKTSSKDKGWKKPAKICSDYLRPSFAAPVRSLSETTSGRNAYLDGLRGFAALLVYILHHEVWAHSGIQGEFILENAFGWDKKYHFVCLPGVRIFFSGGHFAVAVFFIVSGYVLSARPLTLIHERKLSQLAGNLGSALFRRWFRLFIPVICTTSLWMTSWHLFGIRSGNSIAQPPERNYVGEIWKWYCDFKNYSFVFQNEPWNVYNDHLWSIAAEYRGSILVYTSLLAFSRFSRNSRLWCEAGLIYYFLYIVDGWFCALFAMGMLLCDLDLLALKNDLPRSLSRLQPCSNWISYLLLAIALYFGGVPSLTDELDHLRRSPGWYYLSFMKPQAFWDVRWFFRFWAASFTMISVPRIPWLKRLFEGSFCQYMGRISYGFYLVHGPILWTIGDRLYAASGRVREGHIGVVPGWINLFSMPRWGPFGLEMNFLVPQLVLLPLTLWVAEVATKLFDEPSVRFSKWFYSRLLDSDEPPETLPKWNKEPRAL